MREDPTAGDIVLPLPPNAPRTGGRFGRWLGRSILRAGGWHMVGAFPDLPKLVLVGAPHSSNWDGIWGFAAKLALGLDIKILGKRELFWWPLGALTPSWQGLLADFAALYTTGYLQATVKIAAPVVLVLILVDLGFGLIAKTADKLEPNNLAQPIKGAVALAMVGLLVALFFEQVKPMLALGRLAADLSQWLQAGKP